LKPEEALRLDYYKEGNREEFQKLLREVKPFAKIPADREVPLELLEKLIWKYECKYSLMLNYICPVYLPNEKRMYSVTVRNTDTKELYPTVYASSVYEAFCKAALFYYNEITLKGAVGLKDWSRKYET